MKTPDEMAAWFKAMPSKTKENPYWLFQDDPVCICSITKNLEESQTTDGRPKAVPLTLVHSAPLLMVVREFFRRYYESFQSEAQVLCVTKDDAKKLALRGIPILTQEMLGPFEVIVMVLPQENHMGTSNISESFWQARIVDAGITPVARIHSHHILEPYQSTTDYSTLNSGTLEMVIGRIQDETDLHICYWLDVPGTDTKAQTFMAEINAFGKAHVMPRRFHGEAECTF